MVQISPLDVPTELLLEIISISIADCVHHVCLSQENEPCDWQLSAFSELSLVSRHFKAMTRRILTNAFFGNPFLNPVVEPTRIIALAQHKLNHFYTHFVLQMFTPNPNLDNFVPFDSYVLSIYAMLLAGRRIWSSYGSSELLTYQVMIEQVIQDQTMLPLACLCALSRTEPKIQQNVLESLAELHHLTNCATRIVQSGSLLEKIVAAPCIVDLVRIRQTVPEKREGAEQRMVAVSGLIDRIIDVLELEDPEYYIIIRENRLNLPDAAKIPSYQLPGVLSSLDILSKSGFLDRCDLDSRLSALRDRWKLSTFRPLGTSPPPFSTVSWVIYQNLMKAAKTATTSLDAALNSMVITSNGIVGT
ncbi:hypothetical protein C8J56DRAFT_144031 [Mycena floridula]|nr:hypothetical protein C8J56DRAFT_144031 [Mycena floridula]